MAVKVVTPAEFERITVLLRKAGEVGEMVKLDGLTLAEKLMLRRTAKALRERASKIGEAA